MVALEPLTVSATKPAVSVTVTGRSVGRSVTHVRWAPMATPAVHTVTATLLAPTTLSVTSTRESAFVRITIQELAVIAALTTSTFIRNVSVSVRSIWFAVS